MTTTVFSGILAVGAVTWRADPIIVAIGMNLLALGLTGFLLRELLDATGTFAPAGLEGLPDLEFPGRRPAARAPAGPADGARPARAAARRRRLAVALPHVGRPAAARCRRAPGGGHQPRGAGVALPERHGTAGRRALRAGRRAALARQRHGVHGEHDGRPRLGRRRRRHAGRQPAAGRARAPACCSARRRRGASGCRASARPSSSPTPPPTWSRCWSWSPPACACGAASARPIPWPRSAPRTPKPSSIPRSPVDRPRRPHRSAAGRRRHRHRHRRRAGPAVPRRAPRRGDRGGDLGVRQLQRGRRAAQHRPGDAPGRSRGRAGRRRRGRPGRRPARRPGSRTCTARTGWATSGLDRPSPALVGPSSAEYLVELGQLRPRRVRPAARSGR